VKANQDKESEMVVFENKGEIDVSAITTFGVSVKDGDTPIGFFGTGLKYAIAVLLRHQHSITIHSGMTQLDFSVSKRQVRSQDFEFVTMSVDGGAPLDIGFTTQLGKHWEMWMAYREIACNCKDEGGEATVTNCPNPPREGRTQIIVAGDEFEKTHQQRDRFLLEVPADMVLGTMQIHRRQGSTFFYRGVRVHEFNCPGLFTYNQIENLDLTEDRTVKDHWYPRYNVAKAFLQCEDAHMLRTVLTASNDHMEHDLDFHGWSIKPGPVFLQVVGELATDKLTKVNHSAFKVWQETTQKAFSPREVELTRVQRSMMEKAIAFAGKIGFQVEGSYPIKVVESLGPGTMGLALDDTIFIAQRTLDMGTKYLASTLIEEFLHLRHDFKDCTRDMQNYLFERMVSLGEELMGEPL
jgi:hypothetical protein